MEPLPRDTPTSSYPGPVHPCHVDDSELDADARAGNWCAMVPAAAVCCLVCLPVLGVMGLLRLWRACREIIVRKGVF
jgi:hypothetical protein